MSFNLDLPVSLNTFHIGVVDNVKLHLNLPQLKNDLCGDDIRNLKFSHPESINN